MLSKLINNKKGQLGTLQSLTIGLVVVALVLVVGFQILASIQATLSKIGVLQGNLFDYECGIKQEG